MAIYFLIPGLVVWAVGGYFFTRWFINDLLRDGWADTGETPNVLMIHLMAPVMAVGIALAYLLDKASKTLSKSSINNWYGINK